MKFYAIDVETANADYSSICQIGVAKFDGDEIIERWATLINPETYFDEMNIGIHGITEYDVADAPTFSDVYSELKTRIEGKIAVHHMPFDRSAINRACIKYGLELIDTQWLDSARVVKRTWLQFSQKGYGLSNISNFLGINFEHHDALEDAIAAGKVLIEASKQSGLSLDELLVRVKKPISLKTLKDLSVNSDGHLFGEIIVFTGELSLPRRELSQYASALGCVVKGAVSKTTTMLVVGIQYEIKLADGYSKSSKHRKAEELIKEGHNIRILSEDDFTEICNQK